MVLPLARATFYIFGLLVTGASAANKLQKQDESLCDSGTRYVFKAYHPSPWEESWLKQGDKWQTSICAHMVAQKNLSLNWLESVAAFKDGPDYSQLNDFDPEVWSRFVYLDVCSKEKEEFDVYVEPVVGLMRHPLAVDDCVWDKSTKVSTEARDYLTAVGMTPRQFRTLYPGKAYLLDLGTGTNYTSSLEWLVEEYLLHGIMFDEVYAWEKKDISQASFWAGVSPRLASKVHLFNVPVIGAQHSLGQAFQVLSSIWRAGDFVALKIDLDDEAIKHDLLLRLREDARLRHMVGEMWFEPHHNAPEMVKSLNWTDTYSYPRALHDFHDLRAMGVRLHMWP